VGCEGVRLLVRRLWCYGETAASSTCSIPTDCGETRTLHGLGFVSYDPRSGKYLP
jgi:hypothetical protein